MVANKWLIFVIMIVTMMYASGRKNMLNKKYCVQVVTIILTLFSGFRSWQMGDLFHYCNSYLECNLPEWKLEFSSNDTIGLQLFLHYAGKLGISFEGCLFIIAAFVAITLSILIYKYSPSPYWSYIVYLAMGFYIFTFSGLKQSIAMGFIIFAMIAVIERKYVKFIFFVMIATLFHYPALIFLIAYPFANKKIDGLYFIIVGGMVSGVYLFRDQIVQKATEFYYVDNMTFEATEAIGGKVIVMIAILIFALLLRPLHRYDFVYRQVFNIMVLAVIIQTFSVYDNVFTRLADYFFQFVVLFIPLMFQSGVDQAKEFPSHSREIRYFSRNTYFGIQLIITIFALWYYFRYINASTELLSEFHFFWQIDGPSSIDLLKEKLGSLTRY